MDFGISFTPFDQLSAAELNTLVANDNALKDGSGIDDGAITQAKRSGGFKIGIISGASVLNTTGNKDITDVGFRPKLVRFTALPTSSAVAFNLGNGAMDENGNQFVASVNSNPGRNSSQSHCLGFTGSGSGWILRASYVAMLDNGFRINVDTASSAFDVAYEAEA